MGRERLVGALVALGLVLLAGCAGIPTSGPIDRGGRLPDEPRNPGVPFIAEAPRPGASPEEIVLGFLRANADFRGDHRVARLYLTPTARQAWDPDAGTTVFAGVPTPDSGTTDSVVVRAQKVADVDAEGAFLRSPPGATVERAFRLAEVDGQWRIASLADGLMMSAIDLREAYRQVTLYYLGPSREVLVPDPVLLAQLPGTTTQLVSRLLRGPTAGLRSAVGTAFPEGSDLDVAAVPVRGGVASVQLNGAVLRADAEARERMSVQLVWTLRQLGPEIERIRITVNGEDLLTSGAPVEQSRDSWKTYDPDRVVPGDSLYAVRGGAVGRVVSGRWLPLAGPVGQAAGLRTPAVSLDGSQVAVVSRDGEALLVGRIAEDGTLDPVARGGDLARPSWDSAGNLWIVDRAAGTLVVLPSGTGRALHVALPELPGRLSAARVSRDGSRVALITGSGSAARLFVAALSGVDQLDGGSLSDGVVSVIEPREVLPDLRSVRDVAWADAATLVVLGSRVGLRVQPLFVSTDGYQVTEVEPFQGLVAIAAGPGSPEPLPLVGATANGQLVTFRSGRGWQPLGRGTDPGYRG